MDNNYLNKIEWIFMNMRLGGSLISKESVSKIAAGEYVLDASLEEHIAVNRIAELLPLIKTLLGLHEELSPDTLNKFYQVLSGGEKASYRRITPVLFHLSYNPVLPQEIEGELSKLFTDVYRHPVSDVYVTADFIHSNLIRIYPFNDYNEIIARTAMEYYLLTCGKPMVIINMSEQEYNAALSKYLKAGAKMDILKTKKG